MSDHQHNDHGSVATLPTGPVLDEVIRIVRVVDQYAPSGYRVAALRVVRDSVAPGLTSNVWREWAGPDSRVAQEYAREEIAQNRNQREREIADILVSRFGFVAGHHYSTRITRERFPAITVPDGLTAVFDRYGWYVEAGATGTAHLLMEAAVRGTDISAVLAALEMVPEPVMAPDEPTCPHGNVRCTECGGTGCGGFDSWGDPNGCDHDCPECGSSDMVDTCRRCGLDSNCSHEWECTECDATVEWQRPTGWVTAP